MKDHANSFFNEILMSDNIIPFTWIGMIKHKYEKKRLQNTFWNILMGDDVMT